MIRRQKLNGLIVDHRKRGNTTDLTRRPHGSELAPLPSAGPSIIELLEERNGNSENEPQGGTGNTP